MIPWSALLPATGRLLGGWQGYAVAAAVAAAVAGAGAWTVQGWRMGAELERTRAGRAELVADAEARARQAVEDARAREAQIVTRVEEIVDAARTLAQDLERDRRAADAARGGLLDAAKAAARRCAAGQDPAAAGRGQAAGAPGMVLADVLDRVDARAGELAAALDRARAAGIACERQYDEVRAR